MPKTKKEKTFKVKATMTDILNIAATYKPKKKMPDSSQASRMELLGISHELTKFGKTIVITNDIDKIIDGLASMFRIKAHVDTKKKAKKNEYYLILDTDQNFHK